jgi:hypothetical protein
LTELFVPSGRAPLRRAATVYKENNVATSLETTVRICRSSSICKTQDVYTEFTMTASENTNGHGASALCSVDEFLAQEYDYLVVGGGTAGLCVAARLSENPEVKVGVLEAGKNLMDDPNVYTPSLYPTLIGREKYDWCFQSEPQAAAGGKTYSMPRGKLLGGSSGINYLMYVRGSAADYDGWESLGNKGWGWYGSFPCSTYIGGDF